MADHASAPLLTALYVGDFDFEQLDDALVLLQDSGRKCTRIVMHPREWQRLGRSAVANVGSRYLHPETGEWIDVAVKGEQRPGVINLYGEEVPVGE